MRRVLLLIISIVFVAQASAQREQGTWQDFLSYNNATKVTVSSDKVFCATEGGIFYYDLEDNSIDKLVNAVTLSDFGVETMGYSLGNQVLVIVYQNSNIDLVYPNGTVFNLSDLKRKIISGSKSINAISFSENNAYLACDFGVVVINLSKKEVKDTYYIGLNGASVVVNDVAVDDEYIYAATNNGILKAFKTGVNLQDYNNWSLIQDIPRFTEKFNRLLVHSGQVIANYTPEKWYEDEMYILKNGNWESYLPQIRYVYDLQSDGEYITLASREAVFIIDGNHTIVGNVNYYQFDDERISPIKPRSCSLAADGTFWIADSENNLIKVSGERFDKIFPNGPIDNDVFSLKHTGSALWIAPGGMSGFEAPRFQRLNNGEWSYFNKSNHDELSGFHNVLSIEVDPSDENHFFVATWGGGLLEYRNDELIERYNNLNSPLESALPLQPNEPYTRIAGLAFDSEGNLWVTNSECTHNLHKLSPSGEWESFELDKVKNKYNLGDVIVTQNEDKWMLVLKGHDAYVVDKTGMQKKQLMVTSYFNNGSVEYFTRMNDVYSIAEDVDGAIWIGTSKGVAVYSSPRRIWTSDNFYASQPGLDLGDGIYHPLLETETVTAIAVDGANRKWLGTSGSGVYLVSETGEQEILHFTSENSELLSDNITAIAINQKSGEVFFGTENGLVSYQGEATGGNDSYSNVYVYPNPVRETYDGNVTIAGLIENTDIKVTDISGNLVFKTTSLGGQAIWNGKNLNGNRVKTGVYLVFCNDENGEETHITKLLFIN